MDHDFPPDSNVAAVDKAPKIDPGELRLQIWPYATDVMALLIQQKSQGASPKQTITDFASI